MIILPSYLKLNIKQLKERVLKYKHSQINVGKAPRCSYLNKNRKYFTKRIKQSYKYSLFSEWFKQHH